MQTEAFLVGGGGDGKKHCLLVPYFIYDHSTSVKVQSCFDGSVMNSVCDHNVSSSFSFFWRLCCLLEYYLIAKFH